MTGAEGDGNSTEVERQVVGRNIYRKAVFISFNVTDLKPGAVQFIPVTQIGLLPIGISSFSTF